MPKGKHGEEKFYELVKNFLCLGDREIQIMKIITKKEMSVEEISNRTKLSRSSVQRYIKSLVGMQLVDRRAITQGKGRKSRRVTRAERGGEKQREKRGTRISEIATFPCSPPP